MKINLFLCKRNFSNQPCGLLLPVNRSIKYIYLITYLTTKMSFSIKVLKNSATLFNKVFSNRVLISPVINSKFCTKSDDKPKESPITTLLKDAASFEDVKTEDPEQMWSTLPYVQGTKIRNQAAYSFRPKKDPRETSIIMFPGQGQQFVGMAKNLMKFPMAKDLFELANYVLGYDLLKICLNGPQSELNKTQYCQPATLVTSLAALERLKEERPHAIDNCVATAGFSLGEITALIFAGAISFEDGLRLVKIRAEAMQLASEAYEGAMVTIFYGPDSKVNFACKQAKEWCIEKGVENPDCRIASYMYPHCKVVAGNIEAIQFLEKNSKEFKLRKLNRLQVSGAFHSNLMLPAIEPFKKALQKCKIEDPIISVHSNVDGKRYRDAAHIKKQLPKQILKPVCWEQTLHILYERESGEHFPRTFECGPGSSLKTILKQVNAKAWDSAFSIEA